MTAAQPKTTETGLGVPYEGGRDSLEENGTTTGDHSGLNQFLRAAFKVRKNSGGRPSSNSWFLCVNGGKACGQMCA